MPTLKQLILSPIRFIKDRFFTNYPKEFEIENMTGKIVEENSKKIAIYKTKKGKLIKLSPYCTHIGCVVHWDQEEELWHCPCHQSKFSPEGKVLEGPAKKDLEQIGEEKQSQYIVKILKIEEVTHDVKRFKVEKPNGYKFEPGQATEVAVNKKTFKNKFRPFTFTSLNSNDHLEFTIKAYPTDKYPDHTGVTEKIHKLKESDEIIIKEPFGTITYRGEGIFIAGGAGITPFIAIFRDLHNKNQLEGNKLIFSNKTTKDVIIESKLEEWFGADNLILTITRENTPGDKYVAGRINEKMLKKYVDDFSQNFYICGPPKFVTEIKKNLSKLGANKVIIEEW